MYYSVRHHLAYLLGPSSDLLEKEDVDGLKLREVTPQSLISCREGK